MQHFWTKNMRNGAPTLFLSKKIGLHFSRDSNLVRQFPRKVVPMDNPRPEVIRPGSISHFLRNNFRFAEKL